MLFVNNLARNGSKEQLARILPDVCSGKKIGGMGMSEVCVCRALSEPSVRACVCLCCLRARLW
jgi:alkylation response protein AidB-like acyl-CoA dehydrogenase